jgi:flagellum-specific ATP synthase
VVAAVDGDVRVALLGSPGGLRRGAIARPVTGNGQHVGSTLLGRVVDALGNPVDDGGPIVAPRAPIDGDAPPPLGRQRITQPLHVGVRVLDLFTTLARGQRVGLFAGSGVGKSTLLGMMARGAAADCVVICLVGERGREVREFLEDDLGAEAAARAAVVVATSDQPALVRVRALRYATAVAESLADEGKDVLFLCDSLTRFALAQREVGLAAGEPPTARGFTPSVFAALPRLLERTGPRARGSITAVYTVLVDGDDMDEPIADAARSILDGHIVLSRKIAQRNHYPAIDVLQSASRVMRSVISKDHVAWAGQVREWLATYAQAEELINIGAYVRGSNPRVDQSIFAIDRINAFLRQGVDERSSFADAEGVLHSICRSVEAQSAAAQQGAGPQRR